MSPKPLIIAERFHFHRRTQATGEFIVDYVAEVGRWSAHCEFCDYLEQALRDCLVCGLRAESIHKRLLAEADLTLKKSLGLAHGMEAADRNAKSLKMPVTLVQKVSGSSTPCYRCGRSNIDPKECRFCDAECHFCKKGDTLPRSVEPSSHRSLGVKPARPVVARIMVQGLHQPNGWMPLSQKRGKMICSCMLLGNNLHTRTTLTCLSMARS